MKKILMILFSAIAAGLSAAPGISIEGDAKADFGSHRANDPKSATFTIRNSGDSSLEIKGINKTCGGCIVASISAKEIAPGEDAQIKITLVPGTLSGSYSKNFFVETNDPAQRFMQFTFSGTAVPVAEIKPSNLMYLGKIEPGTQAKREFLIVPTENGAEFGEPLAECNYPVKVSSSPGEKGLSVYFEFTPEKNTGDMKCKINIPVLKPVGWPPLEILLSATIAGGQAAKEATPPVKTSQIAVIEYFHQSGCSDCRKIDTFIIPRIEERFKGRYRIEKHDTAAMDSFLRFAHYRDKLDIKGNETVCMIVNGKYAFNGFKNIEACLLKQLGESIKTGEEVESSYKPGNESDRVRALKRHAERITIGALAAAGLIDGINPCVFATLVFFVSVLAVSGVKGRRLLLFGSVYCIACFLTYFLLGLGILRFIKIFSGYEMFQLIFNQGMAFLLVVFAVLSFRDAWQFHRTGTASSVLLQLPESIKDRIHGIIREGAHSHHLVIGAVVTGFLVTLLESVCTGQVYLPALALMAKQEPSSWKWLSYLVLYNVMFIVPLLIIFAASYFGTGIATMVKWSRRDVVIGKILLGLLFIGLAVLMIITSWPHAQYALPQHLP